MPLKSWTRIFAFLAALLAGSAVVLGVCALLDAVPARSFAVVALAAVASGGLWRAARAQQD